LVVLATKAASASGLERPTLLADLGARLAAAMAKDDEARIRAALAAMPDAQSYRLFRGALARTVDTPAVDEVRIVTRSFALPIVFLAASAKPARVPGTLSDIGALQALFERSSALGPTRNFGLSNALCTLESIEQLSPLALYRSVRGQAKSEIGNALPPADLEVWPGKEQTYLRFLVGGGVSPADAPGFAETAAHIGTWARECAQSIAEQLKTPGVQLLVLPRAPKDLLTAPHSGRTAQLEAAFNLFASNAVRRLRMAVGDPVAIVSAHDNADVRITLSSPFAQDLTEGFHWPLHPLDDLEAIERMAMDLFADVRIGDVRVCPQILPAERVAGVPLFPRADEWDALCTRGGH
jgi:hypothetical protein